METFKLAFLCLVASFLTVSCTETTDFNDNDYETNSIRFTAASDIVQSRGLPVLSSNEIPDMGVFAYYTGDGSANNWDAKGATATPDYMNNIQITNSNGVWTYDNPVYWPHTTDANVSFFAYSPYATSANGITMNVSTGIPSITYTVPTNCSDQPDLMASALLNDLNKTNIGPVNFQMRHALTCIGFKASGNGERITKITAKSVKTSGTLTVVADGTPSWSLGTVNGNFEATVDDGVYLDALAQLVNTGGGYLMMIPQTLVTGAGITVELNSGRSFDFDLSGVVWQAGKFINYNLSITPEAALLLTPEKIVLPAAGGFSQFEVIVENGSNLDWTLGLNNAGFMICDNLTDIRNWASGSIPAANVRNTNGTTPGTQFTGTGTKTLYVWKPTANSSPTAEITGTISNVIDPTGVSINVIQLPDYTMATVRDSYMSGEYVGAFWKASQQGERIIRIPVTNAVRAGEWDASVYWLDAGWNTGDIVFSTNDSDDSGVTFNVANENPVDMNNSDAMYRVSGYFSSASGYAISGTGNYIQFRIGLSSLFNATTARPARYALVVLRYGTPRKYHAIFIRQGDDPDYIMYPGDNSLPRIAARRFSPYNVTTSNMGNNIEMVDVGPSYPVSAFTNYPSQAGAFFQWANDGNPVAYNPIYPVKPTLWLDALDGQYWSAILSTQESCPSGYRRPSDGIINYAAANTTTTGIESSEIRQSLYVTPTFGDATSSDNFRWGFYADGFFDRRDHNNPLVSSTHEVFTSAMKANTAVSWKNKDVAYIGTLIFNPDAGSLRENASLFIPAAGTRHSDTGLLIEGGGKLLFFYRLRLRIQLKCGISLVPKPHPIS
ncbi:MAG: fimbrillin family protein [Bacteroides intestinalis]|nr:fimbrillin family protein [Bacteroides intestinalis]